MKKLKEKIMRCQTARGGVALYTGIVVITSIVLFVSTQTTMSSAKMIESYSEDLITKLEDRRQTIEFGEVFKVEDIFDLSDKNLANSEITINNLDTHKLGSFELEVQFVKDEHTSSGIVYLTIVDSTPPVLYLPNKDLTFVEGETVNLFKDVAAEDNADGNLTDKVIVKEEVDNQRPGTYAILYSVEDSSGNVTEKERTLHIIKKEEGFIPEESIEEIDMSQEAAATSPVKQETASFTNNESTEFSDPLTTTQPRQTIKINDLIIHYQNGGQGSGQGIIDSNPSVAVSTWGGAATQSGSDGSNTHFIGHNPGVFSILLGIGMGQKIIVSDGNNVITAYIVNDIRQTDESGVELGSGQDLWDSIVGSGGGERITLQTCLSDTERLLVFAQKE